MTRLLNAVNIALDGNARILGTQEHGGDALIDIGWPWASADRPHRMSRTLRIVVSKELMEDFEATAPNQQQETTRRFVAALAQQFVRFRREHDASRDQSPPVEEWRVTTDAMF